MRILIVDDETLVRIGVKSCIQSQYNSYEIIEAVDGKQALEIAREMKPQLIITDIKMPVMDGLQLIENVNKLELDTRFIVLSCFDEYEYVRKALKMGAKDYILKHKMDPENIYSLIESVKAELDTAGANKNSLVVQNKDSIDIIKQEFIKSLIRENSYSQDFVNEKVKKYNMRLKGKQFSLCILGIDNYGEVKERYTERDHYLLTYSVCNIADELLSNYGNGEVAHYSQNKFLILLAFDTNDQKELLQSTFNIIKEIQTTLQRYLNILSSYGITTPVPSLRGLFKYYGKAQKVYEYKFYKGNKSIIFDYEISQLEEGKGNYLLPDAESFCSQLFCCDKEDISPVVQQMLKGIAGVFEPYPEKLKLFVIDLMEKTLKKMADNYDLFENTISYKELIPKISQAENICYLSDSLCGMLNQIAKGFREKEKRFCSPMVLKVIKLLESRYEENISLEQVAEELKVNPSYLSRAFKKETGENFVDYLTNIRMKKAKELLKATELSVHEVALHVGYPNQQYFSKVFKKLCNITPTEFKINYLKMKV